MKTILSVIISVAVLSFASAAPINSPSIQQTQAYQQSYKNIATNTTTTVKTGAGTLVGIVFNTAGAAANVITVYDNTAGSGTKIGTIDGTLAGGTQLAYNVAFSTGITFVTATGTCANITVVYR